MSRGDQLQSGAPNEVHGDSPIRGCGQSLLLLRTDSPKSTKQAVPEETKPPRVVRECHRSPVRVACKREEAKTEQPAGPPATPIDAVDASPPSGRRVEQGADIVRSAGNAQVISRLSSEKTLKAVELLPGKEPKQVELPLHHSPDRHDPRRSVGRGSSSTISLGSALESGVHKCKNVSKNEHSESCFPCLRPSTSPTVDRDVLPAPFSARGGVTANEAISMHSASPPVRTAIHALVPAPDCAVETPPQRDNDVIARACHFHDYDDASIPDVKDSPAPPRKHRLEAPASGTPEACGALPADVNRKLRVETAVQLAAHEFPMLTAHESRCEFQNATTTPNTSSANISRIPYETPQPQSSPSTKSRPIRQSPLERVCGINNTNRRDFNQMNDSSNSVGSVVRSVAQPAMSECEIETPASECSQVVFATPVQYANGAETSPVQKRDRAKVVHERAMVPAPGSLPLVMAERAVSAVRHSKDPLARRAEPDLSHSRTLPRDISPTRMPNPVQVTTPLGTPRRHADADEFARVARLLRGSQASGCTSPGTARSFSVRTCKSRRFAPARRGRFERLSGEARSARGSRGPHLLQSTAVAVTNTKILPDSTQEPSTDCLQADNQRFPLCTVESHTLRAERTTAEAAYITSRMDSRRSRSLVPATPTHAFAPKLTPADGGFSERTLRQMSGLSSVPLQKQRRSAFAEQRARTASTRCLGTEQLAVICDEASAATLQRLRSHGGSNLNSRTSQTTLACQRPKFIQLRSRKFLPSNRRRVHEICPATAITAKDISSSVAEVADHFDATKHTASIQNLTECESECERTRGARECPAVAHYVQKSMPPEDALNNTTPTDATNTSCRLQTSATPEEHQETKEMGKAEPIHATNSGSTQGSASHLTPGSHHLHSKLAAFILYRRL